MSIGLRVCHGSEARLVAALVEVDLYLVVAQLPSVVKYYRSWHPIACDNVFPYKFLALPRSDESHNLGFHPLCEVIDC